MVTRKELHCINEGEEVGGEYYEVKEGRCLKLIGLVPLYFKHLYIAVFY